MYNLWYSQTSGATVFLIELGRMLIGAGLFLLIVALIALYISERYHDFG